MQPRPATAADADGVVALIGAVFAEYGFLWDAAAEVPDLYAFDRHYAPPRGAFWVVEDGGRIVGSVGVSRTDGGEAELHRLYVDPARRRHGLGQALVGTVETWCRAARVHRLFLWSDTRFERAHALYARRGFIRGPERELPGDPNQTREYRYELDLTESP